VDGGGWGESFCAIWSRPQSAADDSVWRASARDGVLGDYDRLRTAGGEPRVSVAIDGPYMLRRKSRSHRGPETQAIGLLPSRAQLGIYAKFALSFAKLPKM